MKCLIDYRETYGPAVIERFFRYIGNADTVLDVGAGTGRDLKIAQNVFSDAQLMALECYPPNVETLVQIGVQTQSANIEQDCFPFDDESLDVVLANQVLEHTKELFWIFHEVSRVLKVGGHFIVGVPNVASLHNRIGLLFGKHPTQSKACSAHIRCFSKNDFLLFVNETCPGLYELEMFAGSQFYPFPGPIARVLSRVLPNMAFSIFFLLRKVKKYDGTILEYPLHANLETNYKTQ